MNRIDDQLVGVQVMLRAFLCTLAMVIALRPKLDGWLPSSLGQRGSNHI
tara:strand:+ start:657 stop:803 length:147 start_codon:yes stop_codon:yes gene_type:complete